MLMIWFMKVLNLSQIWVKSEQDVNDLIYESIKFEQDLTLWERDLADQFLCFLHILYFSWRFCFFHSSTIYLSLVMKFKS